MASVDDDLEDDPSGLGAALTGIPATVTNLAKQAAGGIGPIDETTKAGLIGFAVRMLSPAWGGTAGKLAGAIGAGAESAGAQEAYQTEQTHKKEERASKERVAAGNRASREELARMRDETSRAIATERVMGAMDRQRLRSGGAAKGGAEAKWENDRFKIHAGIIKDRMTELGISDAEVVRRARERAREDLDTARSIGLFDTPGSKPDKLGKGEDEPSAAAPPTKPGATAPPKKPAAGAAAPKKLIPLEELKKQPDFETLFANPNERRNLLNKGYTREEIEREEEARGLDPADYLSILKKFVSPRKDRKLPQSQ